ncbi:putative sorting nexin 2A [Iris pallida]|uniref:Sorting nexin 2A n=1 Tax=Iris pallida TaxID=29817 RepID=A0AAX6HT96_IRIPA|nr:putative sorting nexin 2A [Iris pallida]
MMGSETHFSFDPPPPKEDLETLALSDPLSAVDPPSDGSDPLLHSTSPSSSSSSFPDPPSYADVIFTPFNGTTSAATSSSTSPDFRPSTSPYLRISVSDPQKEQQEASTSLVPGGNTYVTYLITTETRDLGRFGVRRRFRDFVTLADRLAESYRGHFIPPRPDKSVVESQVMQKQEFVEQRRSALEKYLLRLAAHPVVGRSDELAVFLKAQGRLPLARSVDVASRVLDGAARLPSQLFGEGPVAAVGPEDVGQPAKGGRDLLRMFRELRQSVANDWGGGRPLVVEEDREFLERKEKVQDLEQQLSTASQQAEALVKAQQDIGETTGELGLAFFKLGKFETEEAVYESQRTRAADFKRLATAAVRASRSYRELNAQSVKHLDILHEYLGMMLAVHSAFSDRSNALLTVQTLMSDLSSLHTRAERLEAASSKIFGGDRSRTRKVEELKETIRITEDAKLCAIREYERIKENNRNELERLDRERRDDFLGMLKGL